MICHYDAKKLWCREFFIYKLDFRPLSSSQWRLKRMRPVQQKSPPPPCCQPIVAIVTWTMSTKAQLLWGDGGALHLLMTQFSFQASVLRLFLSFLFGHLCLDFIIDRDRGSNKKSTNEFSAPMNLTKCPPPPERITKFYLPIFFRGHPHTACSARPCLSVSWKYLIKPLFLCTKDFINF